MQFAVELYLNCPDRGAQHTAITRLDIYVTWTVTVPPPGSCGQHSSESLLYYSLGVLSQAFLA